MEPLRQIELRKALEVVRQVAEAPGEFARRGVELLPKLVAAEFATLSICDLVGARRIVAGVPSGAVSPALCESFDRHFRFHPLVEYHAVRRGRGPRRISDSLPFARFRETALYKDYYRRIGVDHVLAVPMYVDERLLVSFVLNRVRRDFSDRDCTLLQAVGGPLAALYRQARAREEVGITLSGLTRRERELLQWLVAGKSDAQIAAILGISARTVQKHLQHAYEKLGVENRTAAVMRMLRG